MTKKLYYDDVYQDSFISKVVKRNKDESGRYYVVLEKTAFYPTGGGQPHDTGKINGVIVLDVEEVDGEIRHFVERDFEEEVVKGEINWERRFDHMQQHAGQHLLSAVFEDKLGYKTISFHLGQETCTIDLDTPSLSERDLNNAEKMVNKRILENKPIITKWVNNKDELTSYSLRKELSVSENIRLVMIPEVDYNGCGGTHPKSTGEVSGLKILHTEKQKKHIRVHFVCGQRVFNQLHEKHKLILELTKTTSASQPQLNDAVNRLLDHTRKLEEKVEYLSNQLLKYEAQELISIAEIINEQIVIRKVFKERSINDLQQIARELVVRENTIVYFISDHQDKLQLVLSRSEDIDLNLNQVLKSILPLINGKGGGKPSFVQGGGDRLVEPEQLLDQLVQHH